MNLLKHLREKLRQKDGLEVLLTALKDRYPDRKLRRLPRGILAWYPELIGFDHSVQLCAARLCGSSVSLGAQALVRNRLNNVSL